MQKLALKTTENGDEVIIPLKLKEPVNPNYKLTVPKQKKILQYLAKRWNYTKAAASVGVNRQAISHHIDNQTDFGKAILALKEAKNDDVREIIITMACSGSREGFNDRKLYAQANLPEYKPQSDQINIAVINTTQASGELHNLIAKIPAPEKER